MRTPIAASLLACALLVPAAQQTPPRQLEALGRGGWRFGTSTAGSCPCAARRRPRLRSTSIYHVSRDNSQADIAGEPLLQAYRLDGTMLWQINLGRNIREGVHCMQFMVYDLDGGGRAEVACKTVDGTITRFGSLVEQRDEGDAGPFSRHSSVAGARRSSGGPATTSRCESTRPSSLPPIDCTR